MLKRYFSNRLLHLYTENGILINLTNASFLNQTRTSLDILACQQTKTKNPRNNPNPFA